MIYDKNVAISSFMYNATKSVFCDLLPMPYSVLKGEVLSYYAYNEFGRRKSNDIDILIPRSELNKVEHILLKSGFEPTDDSRKKKLYLLSMSHQSVPWRKRITDNFYVNIDINIDILWGEYTGKRVPLETFLEKSNTITIYGQTIKCLDINNMIVQLALHIYKDMNSIYLMVDRKNNCLQMLYEFYLVIKNNTKDIDFNEVYAVVRSYDLEPYMYYVLHYTAVLTEDKHIYEISNLFKTDFGASLLDKFGLSEKERKKLAMNEKERIYCCNLSEVIASRLTPSDWEKVKINRQVFSEGVQI